ncbi:choline transporter protein 1 [Quercus suber]|uniref:Choline transporter protein 1 n=1 Tax=Quercus suber TaxID=58331 RepID=A0AAW0K493_QUESU
MRGPLGAVIGRYSSSDGNTQMGGIIRHNRKCRDIAFLVIFIAFWVAMIVNSSFGFNQGNPLRLTYGLDYKGNVCGDKNAQPGLRQLELRYWLNPNQVYQSGLKGSEFKLANARSICLLDCPFASEDQLNWVCDYPDGDIHLSMDDWIDRNYDYYEFLTPEMRNSSLQLQGPCYPVIFPSVNVYWSCQYIARASNISLRHWQQMGGVNINEDIIIDKSIHRAINSRSSVLKRYMADIGKAWPVLIVCGGFLPLFLSVIWLLMIRHFVAAMPWLLSSLLLAGWIGNDAISPIIGEHDPYIRIFGREIHHIRAVAVLMTFIMIVAVLTSIAIVRRILMATSVLKATALHLFSSGQVVQNDCNTNCCAYDLVSKRVNCDHCCGYSIHYTPHIGVAILFHLFGCYWATQFFIACSSTVIAGSVASYYWARGETSLLSSLLLAGWIGNDAISPIIGEHDPYIRIFGREIHHIRAVAVLMTFIMIVAVLTSIAIVRRILMATSVLKAKINYFNGLICIQVAAKVIGEVQALIIFPIIPYTILAIFYMFWFSAALHLFSSGQVVQNDCNTNCCAYDLVSKRVNCDHCCGYSIHYTPHIGVAILFHLFGCYWATQFFIACSSTVIAGSVASYYWARGETSPEIPFLPVFSSMKRLMRYGLGSIALGSLIVSFVESIRFMLESIRRKLKVSSTTPHSYIGKAAFHSSRFCFRCIEWTIKSVNRNAYIMIAITGKSFCKASAIATELIINNILRIGRVNVIGDVILFLGKLCVSLSSALFAFLMLDTHKYRSAHNKISSPVFPVVVCWGLGYVVATLFFAVVEMSIDTIILSFCQDSEEHQGTAQYAPPLLIETLNDQNEMQRLTQGPH